MSAATVEAVPVLPPSMVERMTLILDALGGPATRLSLEQVARRTGLPRSTAHRILDQLERLAWVEHRSGGWCLGTRALSLGGDGGSADLRAAAAPVLHELAVRTRLVVHLAVLEGADVRYLDKVGGPGAASVPSRVGGRAPAHCTAVGKAVLAALPPEAVDERLAGGLVARTPRSVGTLGALHDELGRVRARRGLALERGECAVELACVGAAVPGPDGPLAGLSLVAPADAPLERVAPLVVDAARRIAAALSSGLR